MTPPQGFFPLPPQRDAAFAELTGPLWLRIDGTALIGGMLIERRHCNPIGNCHGGMLATFCDVHMALAALFQSELTSFMPTINLSIDYLAPVPLGAWIEGRADTVVRTGGMQFVSYLLRIDGQPVLRATGIYKIPRPDSGTETPQRQTIRQHLIDAAAAYRSAS